MLGGDTLWPIMTSEIVHGPSKDQPVVVRTKYGWGLAEPINNVSRSLLSCINLMKAHVLRVDVDCEPKVSSYSNESDQRTSDLRMVIIVKLPCRRHHNILPDSLLLGN